MDIPSAMAFMHVDESCKLDEAAIRSLCEDDFGYGLRTYERREGDNWSELKKKFKAR